MLKNFRRAERITLLIERPELSDSFFRRSSSSGSLANERINFGLRRLLSFSVKGSAEFMLTATIQREAVLDK
jgi:hypothetical protein